MCGGVSIIQNKDLKTLSILNILLTRSTVQPDGNPGIPAPCSFNKNCLFHHSTRAVARSYY